MQNISTSSDEKEQNRLHDQNEGWRHKRHAPSLPESYQTIPVPAAWPWWRKMMAFAGPGYLVAVGYMDPGNWATDLAGGSKYGYTLLCVILMSNIMAMILQTLAGKLGVATGRDLAQACKDHYTPAISFTLWILCEIAICACDLAEVIGSAIALNLLFQIPLLWGVCITAFDVLLIMYCQHLGFRYVESVIIAMSIVIGGCFWMEILYAQPAFMDVMAGFLPKTEILFNPDMLYLSIGILGATVMPHNLYLHSSIVQTRKYPDTVSAKKEAIKYLTIDSTVALFFALFVNASILIVAAAVFHTGGNTEVAEIQDAYKLLSPGMNTTLASTLFAVALLASGQNSTLTSTLAGQIVMEGFLNLRLRPWLRRLITRGLAIIPAIICIAVYGESEMEELLIFSQVILSLQLGFAVIPLVMFTSDKKKMGPLVNSKLLTASAWVCAIVIVVLNIKYVVDFFMELL